MDKKKKKLYLYAFITAITIFLVMNLLKPENKQPQPLQKPLPKTVQTQKIPPKNLTDRRPVNNLIVFDYTNKLSSLKEYTEKYIQNNIQDVYNIEVIIAALPDLQGEAGIEELANKIFNNWNIGKAFDNKGILILFVDNYKLIKLEVAANLEDVFTDSFAGVIQDKYLKPYYDSGELEKGIAATLEALEKRAGIKMAGSYSAEQIAQLDRELISMGAGAVRDLKGNEPPEEKEIETAITDGQIKGIEQKYPAGKTPEDAWKTMIKIWKDKEKSHYPDVYTEVTKLMYRDFNNLPDSHYEENYETYANKEFQALVRGNYAVIDFGVKDGWENSPFLFVKDEEGWKFNIVSQRKLVRMGPSPSWGVERTISPYTPLLRKYPGYKGIDIPLEEFDKYSIEKDSLFAEKILNLEEKYQTEYEKFEIAFNLARLYSITAMGIKGISLFDSIKENNKNNPEIHKYTAIANIDSTYQYNKALESMKKYVEIRPYDEFGQQTLGYLYQISKKYSDSLKHYKYALELNPGSCYTNTKISQLYGEIFLDSKKSNPERNSYKQYSIEHYNKSKYLCKGENVERFAWLSAWYRNNFGEK